MEDLLNKISNMNLNIDSASAVEIARIWQDVQYFRSGVFAFVIFIIFTALLLIIFKVND